MALFVCPSCGETNELDDKFIGKKGRCKKCQTIGKITSDEGDTLEEATLVDEPAQDADYDNEYAEDYEDWPPPEPPPLDAPPRTRKKRKPPRATQLRKRVIFTVRFLASSPLSSARSPV